MSTPVQRFTAEKRGVDNLIPVKVLSKGYLAHKKQPPPPRASIGPFA